MKIDIEYQVIQIRLHTWALLTSFINRKVKHNRNYQVFQGYPRWYLL